MAEIVTPLIQQYLQIKEKYAEEIIFFQVGDFYELFFEDAKLAANILSITLTKRGTYQGEHIPLCGVPVHMIQHYYPKLIKNGYTVIICNQNEIAKPGKIVNRVVSEIITPSSNLNSDADEHIYSLFILFRENTIESFWFEFGNQEILYYIFHNDEVGNLSLASQLQKYSPKEVITNKDSIVDVYSLFKIKKSIKTIEMNSSNDQILSFLHRYKLSDKFADVANLFLSYMQKYFETLLNKNYFLFKEIPYQETVFLDKATIKYLECVANLSNQKKDGSLYDVLDKTVTKMGSRLLKLWILHPVQNIEVIQDRQNMIKACLALGIKEKKKLMQFMQECGDIERFLHRLRLKKIRDKELPFLKNFIEAWLRFVHYYQQLSLADFYPIDSGFISDDIIKLIQNTILSKEPIVIEQNEHYINAQSSDNLYLYYQTIFKQGELLEKLVSNERMKSSIDDLIIKKTPLYGYTFELSKIKENKHVIPDYFKRVQTLSQKERYLTLELEQFTRQSEQAYFLYCQEEQSVKNSFIDNVMAELQSFFIVIEKLKYLDVCFSLATIAYENRWVCPTMIHSGMEVEIIDGKHPVVSCHKLSYVANSLALNENKKIAMITGPNMGGKSTYMRQNALIILLSHIGSFIPAKKACIPIMEKILTRVGASDSVLEGKSTFYLELEELKTIITLSNSRSFVIIDEIGRGTSTYDGMSLAAAIIGYLINHNNPYLLCATHYHELFQILKNKNILWCFMKATIVDSGIVFLYQIEEGCSDESMGILLAKQIGIDDKIITLANDYFLKLVNKQAITQSSKKDQPEVLIEIEPKVLHSSIFDDIHNFDIENKTPLESQIFLYELKKRIEK